MGAGIGCRAGSAPNPREGEEKPWGCSGPGAPLCTKPQENRERGGEIPDGIRESSEVEPRGLWGSSRGGRAQGELILLILRGQEPFQAGAGALHPSHGPCPGPRRSRRDHPAQSHKTGLGTVPAHPWVGSETPPNPFHHPTTLPFPFSSFLDQIKPPQKSPRNWNWRL